MPPRIWPAAALLLLACSSDPAPGTERAPCYPNGTCNRGLVCRSDLCVREPVNADAGAPTDAARADGGGADASLDGGPADTGPRCVSFLPPLANPEVDGCVSQECCPELRRCAADPTCASCAPGGLATCGANPRAMELDLCVRSMCLPPPRLGACGSGLSSASQPAQTECLDVYCCAPITACVNDPECLACARIVCDGNALYDAIYTCYEDNCAQDICETRIHLATKNRYQCKRCQEETCCSAWEACMGGVSPPTAPAIQMCSDCVDDPTGTACMSAPPGILEGADQIGVCTAIDCGAECAVASQPPVVRTIDAVVTASQTVIIRGEVTSSGDSFVRERGVCLGPAAQPEVCGNYAQAGGTGIFQVEVPLAEIGGAGEVFYARATALNQAGRVYGEDVGFRLLAPGMPFEGGIIFATDPNGVHGLIAAPDDQDPFIQWWDDSVNPAAPTGAVATGVGAGAANTAAIVNAQGAGNYAARPCADLVLNGYQDWYLPSKDELNLLLQNAASVGNLPPNTGYWSSSEVGTMVWIQITSTGVQTTVESTMRNHVRAIRAF